MKKNPQYNFKASGNMNHIKQHSEFDVDLRYGKNMKDENSHVEVSASLDHAIKTWDDASTNFTGQLVHPGKVF